MTMGRCVGVGLVLLCSLLVCDRMVNCDFGLRWALQPSFFLWERFLIPGSEALSLVKKLLMYSGQMNITTMEDEDCSLPNSFLHLAHQTWIAFRIGENNMRILQLKLNQIFELTKMSKGGSLRTLRNYFKVMDETEKAVTDLSLHSMFALINLTRVIRKTQEELAATIQRMQQKRLGSDGGFLLAASKLVEAKEKIDEAADGVKMAELKQLLINASKIMADVQSRVGDLNDRILGYDQSLVTMQSMLNLLIELNAVFDEFKLFFQRISVRTDMLYRDYLSDVRKKPTKYSLADMKTVTYFIQAISRLYLQVCESCFANQLDDLGFLIINKGKKGSEKGRKITDETNEIKKIIRQTKQRYTEQVNNERKKWLQEFTIENRNTSTDVCT